MENIKSHSSSFNSDPIFLSLVSMGKGFPCFVSISISKRRRSSAIKLIFSDGLTRILTENNHLAGEIMIQFPLMMICHAHSFFIGHPIPSLNINDKLIAGETYFVLPLDPFSSLDILSTSSLAALGARNTDVEKLSGPCPFQYVRSPNGELLVKVMPQFILRLISPATADGGSDSDSDGGKFLSTPELKKHYDELVGSKGQVWTPKLETISEYKIRRYSPSKFVGFKCKQKEG